jgi:putative oxidoreductase
VPGKIMKIAIIIVRMLMGLMFVMASVVFLFKLAPQPELKGSVKLFMDGLTASGYLMYLLKITELVCGLAFISGRFVPLATVVIFPVTLNILFYAIFLGQATLPVAITLMVANLFLAYACRNNYQTLLASKIA